MIEINDTLSIRKWFKFPRNEVHKFCIASNAHLHLPLSTLQNGKWGQWTYSQNPPTYIWQEIYVVEFCEGNKKAHIRNKPFFCIGCNGVFAWTKMYESRGQYKYIVEWTNNEWNVLMKNLHQVEERESKKRTQNPYFAQHIHSSIVRDQVRRRNHLKYGRKQHIQK